MIITSIDNKKIKELCKLYDKKYRKDSDLFIVEGELISSDFVKSICSSQIMHLIESIDMYDFISL